MNNYKQFLNNYYCIIKEKNLLPLNNLLKSLCLMIQTINSKDIDIYNNIISGNLNYVLEKLNNSQYKLHIIKEIQKDIYITSVIDDGTIRGIIGTILIIIDNYSKILLNKRETYKSKEVINNDFLNGEFVQLGNIDGGEFAKKFINLTYFPKISASNSVIIYGNINPSMISNSVKRQNSNIIDKRYYMKIFRTDKFTEALVKELNIYEVIFNLAKYNITPHILNRICTGKIVNVLDLFDFVKGREHIGKMMSTPGTTFGSFANNEAYMIMTEQGSKVVRDYNKNKDFQIDEVIFQLLYSLYVFSKIGFYHYDLHNGNSFIYELDKPTDLYYKVMGKYYHIKTKYFIKIYDFDYSKIIQDTELIINDKTKITFNKMFDSFDTSPDSQILNKKDIDLMLMSWNDLKTGSKDVKLDLFKKEYRQVLAKLTTKDDINKLMENIWKTCTFFREFEIPAVNENENLVYTIDNYKIRYLH